jgi:hypothetical protein
MDTTISRRTSHFRLSAMEELVGTGHECFKVDVCGTYIRCTGNGSDGIESTCFHPPCLMNLDWSEIRYVADVTSIIIRAPYSTMEFERCGPNQRAFTAYARLWIASIIGIYSKAVMMITLQITGMYA